MLEVFLEQMYFMLPILVTIFILSIGAFAVWLPNFLAKRSRKNPLTQNLLRMPGASVLKEFNEAYDKFQDYLIGLLTLPLAAGSMIFYNLGSTNKQHIMMMLAFGIITIAFVPFGIIQIVRLKLKRDRLRLGFECEVAVGQELNQLMRDGYYVFHDFPAEKFNIDHIVIGKGGVFAVETKGRSKRKNKKSNWENARVKFDGEKLIFPTWTEIKPIEQANNNAKWLENWIKKNTGEDIKVISVLTLPGWYVEENNDKSLRPRVINPSRIVAGLKEYQSVKISSNEIIEKIAHKIEEKCRDIEPKAYKNV